jgi:hypothetical protein
MAKQKHDTLQLPSTIVASNSKQPSAATTLRKEYQDLVAERAERAEMKNKFDEDALQRTEIQDTINSLQIQLQAKQTILGNIVATASDTKIALEAANASVREKRSLADQAERAEKRLTCLLASHRMNGTTFTRRVPGTTVPVVYQI